MRFTPEELDELRESFAYNDANDDGKIEFEEFVSMLEALESGISNDEARVGFDSIDGDGSGSIDLDEFVAWWSER